LLNSELVLDKHASKFIDPKNLNKRIHGITYDENGQTLITDGIQLLRIKGFPEINSAELRDLKGNKLNVVPVNFNHFFSDTVITTELNVKETLGVCKTILAVMKVAKIEDIVNIINNEEGKLVIRFQSEVVSGNHTLVETKPINKYLSISRFIKCLSVFDGLSDKVYLKESLKYTEHVFLSIPGVDTLLMCVRKN